ncbi:type II secretion system F family protein [Hyphomonas sp. WL0036]|uniref:type II secretion system F family protein n=1 Tax=Hyphomonas sediminis TaxID=2866160 RepID=UPI001C804D71|nr:type II secretion system F family protein [Hyphomonas sediminis]MBY9067053.1 type II secretion system F family protein [Hyphomonas sediminis]
MFGLPDIASLDQKLVIPAIMALGALVLAVQSIIGLVSDVQTQRIVNRRLQFKERYATHNEAMVELRKSRGLDRDGNLALSLHWLNQLIVRSGLQFQPARWAVMAAGAATVAGIAAFIYLGGLKAAVPVFLLVLLAGPVLVIRHIANKRAKKLAVQLPDALQIVCRSLEAGHPVATAVGLVAREMPDPIGTEFGMTADEVSYGMSLTNAVQRMAGRAGDPDVELFAATVRLQEKTGGNLTELLKSNTNTIRERQTMRLKVRAASSEGRVSAMILTAAPFIVMAAIHLLRPEFYGRVINEPLIQYGFAGLFVWMGIGNLVMNRMINFKI